MGLKSTGLPSYVPVHNNLDNYQRFLLNNQKTSLRNKMSDLGPIGAPSRPGTLAKRSSTVRTAADSTQLQLGASAEMWSTKPARQTAESRDEGDSVSRGGVAEQSFAVDDEAPFANDVQDAAGYSELQAAFERAYEKMLKDPPASVVDTVLSTAWKPRSKKSAALRTSFQKQQEKTTEWDTRSPVYERKLFYDSIRDQHCRRIVENPLFAQTLLRTRPAADYLLARRIMDEESAKMALKRGRKKKLSSRRGRRGKTERWQQTVRRFVQGAKDMGAGDAGDAKTRIASNPEGAGSAADEALPATQGWAEEAGGNADAGMGAEGGPNRSTGEVGEVVHPGFPEPVSTKDLGKRAMDAVEELKKAWGVTEGGVNAQFNSLNSVIMSAGHRPEAFQALCGQLEKLWTLLNAPEKEVEHVRRFCMGEPSATNLAHLFYQVSRWTQYHMQVLKTCDLIYRREMLLLDLRDHLLLAGGVPDEALTAKMSDLFAFSREALQHVTAVRTCFPGAGGEGCLLLDYTRKVRQDVVDIRRQAPAEMVPATGFSESFDAGDDEDLGQTARQDTGAEYTQHKVKLAAELVLDSVKSEAAAYLKLLAADSQRAKRTETARPI